MESKEAIASVLEILEADDFYKPAHVEIYEAILALFGRGSAPDAITVAEELKRRDSLDRIGGKPYIHGLLEAYPTASSAARYARIVEEHARLRRLVEAGNLVQEIGFSIPEDVDAAVDEAEDIIYQVADRRMSSDVFPIRPLLGETMVEIEHLYERGESVTGLATGFPDLDDMTSGFQRSNLIIVAARPSMGKCLSAGSLVDDPSTGERLTIEEFVAQNRRSVVALGPEGELQKHEVTDWIPNGKQQTFRLRTRLGRTIVATANHPLLQLEGWVPLEEVQVGEFIAVPRHLPTFGRGQPDWSLGRIRLLAYFIAEGNLTGPSMARFTNNDPEIAKDFCDSLQTEFPDCTTTQHGISYRARAIKRSRKRNAVVEWLASLGLMGKSTRQKRFPRVVWRFDPVQLAEFIKTLFSCDGTVYSMSGFARIEFTVASEGLAEDVQHALTRFGIVAKLWKKTAQSWRVEITEPQSIQIYQSAIGWIGEKNGRLFDMSPGFRRSNNGHLPKEVWKYVRKAAAQRDMSLAELCRRAGENFSNPHARRRLPHYRLTRYAEILDDDDLRWFAKPDLYWDEITSIDPAGEEDVYDITVAGAHNFVANDICVHNSALMGDFALHAAMKVKKPVILFNLEMSKQELVKRFLASEARVDSQRISKGSLQEQDWSRLSSALGRLADAPIFIDDSANVTLMEIRAKCRRIKAKHGLGIVIIDYLQLMQSPKRSENRQQEVSEISRNLKILARELEVPVVCASQLNRGVEFRSDKRPLLGDLRESGSIEQDSDVVMFIYRDEVYNPDSEARGEAELIIAKHRNGPTGTVRLAFMNQYTKFASIARTPGY